MPRSWCISRIVSIREGADGEPPRAIMQDGAVALLGRGSFARRDVAAVIPAGEKLPKPVFDVMRYDDDTPETLADAGIRIAEDGTEEAVIPTSETIGTGFDPGDRFNPVDYFGKDYAHVWP